MCGLNRRTRISRRRDFRHNFTRALGFSRSQVRSPCVIVEFLLDWNVIPSPNDHEIRAYSSLWDFSVYVFNQPIISYCQVTRYFKSVLLWWCYSFHPSTSLLLLLATVVVVDVVVTIISTTATHSPSTTALALECFDHLSYSEQPKKGLLFLLLFLRSKVCVHSK